MPSLRRPLLSHLPGEHRPAFRGRAGSLPALCPPSPRSPWGKPRHSGRRGRVASAEGSSCWPGAPSCAPPLVGCAHARTHAPGPHWRPAGTGQAGSADPVGTGVLGSCPHSLGGRSLHPLAPVSSRAFPACTGPGQVVPVTPGARPAGGPTGGSYPFLPRGGRRVKGSLGGVKGRGPCRHASGSAWGGIYCPEDSRCLQKSPPRELCVPSTPARPSSPVPCVAWRPRPVASREPCGARPLRSRLFRFVMAARAQRRAGCELALSLVNRVRPGAPPLPGVAEARRP